MPYCSAVLKTETEDAETVIDKIAMDKFHAQNAYPLTSGMWNIDAGKNDIRAIHRDNNGIIRFFCRSKEDLSRTERKIADFANENNDIQLA